MSDWTFFSNYGHVLVCLSRDHDARLRDVASQVGITERAVQKIVKDLQDDGYLEISKHGRRNRYRINNRKALRHPIQSGCTVGQMLGLFDKPQAGQAVRIAPAEEKAEDQKTGEKRLPATSKPPSTVPPSRDSGTGDTGGQVDSGDQGQLF